jgi:ParB/RepB/Spo0J family partition protein
MPLQDNYQRLRVDSIGVLRDDRQRRDLKLDEHFLRSIRQNGVMNPIIVQVGGASGRPYTLIAGERRLEATKAIGGETIPVRLASELSPTELAIIELEENIKRAELEWPDQAQAIKRVHELHKQSDPAWTMGETAQVCSLHPSMISMYITVANELSDPRVRDSGTIREALNLIKRRQERETADALQDLLDGPEEQSEATAELIREATEAVADGIFTIDPEQQEQFEQTTGLSTSPHLTFRVPEPAILPSVIQPSIVPGSFTEWAPRYEGKKFNLLHCDFPYGVNLFGSNGIRSGPNRSQMGRDTGDAYADSPNVYWELLQCLTDNLDRLMSISGHILFWLDGRPETIWRTLEHFRQHAPSIEFSNFPLIWPKSDNAGIASRPSHFPRHTYEVCLFGTRGNRPLIRLVSDQYPSPTDKDIHVSCKPEPMLKHFMRMVVDEHTRLFDPTCGSGSALRAAESLGAGYVFGLERDPEMAERALRALEDSRRKRNAAEILL